MLGQHIYMRCARGYYADQGQSDQIGMKTAAMTDGLLPMNVVRTQIEPKCNLDESFARKMGLLNKRASVLTLYHPCSDAVAVTRNSWVSNKTNDAREGVFAFSQIATEQAYEQAMDDCGFLFNPDAYEPYQSVAKRMLAGGNVGLNPAYYPERIAPVTPPDDVFDVLQMSQSTFLEYINMLLMAMSGECSRVAVVMPKLSSQRWIAGEVDDAERMLMQTLRMLPRFLRRKLTATTHSGVEIGSSLRDIMLFFINEAEGQGQIEGNISRQMGAWVDLRTGTCHVPTKNSAVKFAHMLWDARHGEFRNVEKFGLFMRDLFHEGLDQIPPSPLAMELCMRLFEADPENPAHAPGIILAGAQLFAGQTHWFQAVETMLATAASSAKRGDVAWPEESLKAAMILLSRASSTRPMDSALYSVLLTELGKGKGDDTIVRLLGQECAKKPAACEAVSAHLAQLADRSISTLPKALCQLTLDLALSTSIPQVLREARQWLVQSLQPEDERRILALDGYAALCTTGRLDMDAAEKYCRILLRMECDEPNGERATRCLEDIERAVPSNAALTHMLAEQVGQAVQGQGGIEYLTKAGPKERFYRLLQVNGGREILMKAYEDAMCPLAQDGKGGVRNAFMADQTARFAKMAASGEAGLALAVELELKNLLCRDYEPTLERQRSMLKLVKRAFAHQNQLADGYYMNAVRRNDAQAIQALKADGLLPGVYVRLCNRDEAEPCLDALERELSCDSVTRAQIREAGQLAPRAICRYSALLDEDAYKLQMQAGDDASKQLHALVEVYWGDFREITQRLNAKMRSAEALSSALEGSVKGAIKKTGMSQIARYMYPEDVVHSVQMIYAAYERNEENLRSQFNIIRMLDNEDQRYTYLYLEDLASRHGSSTMVRDMVCNRLTYHLERKERKPTQFTLGRALWLAMFSSGIGNKFDVEAMLYSALYKSAAHELMVTCLVQTWISANRFVNGPVGLVRNVLGKEILDAAYHEPALFSGASLFELLNQIYMINREFGQALQNLVNGKELKRMPRPYREDPMRTLAKDCLTDLYIYPIGREAPELRGIVQTVQQNERMRHSQYTSDERKPKHSDGVGGKLQSRKDIRQQKQQFDKSKNRMEGIKERLDKAEHGLRQNSGRGQTERDSSIDDCDIDMDDESRAHAKSFPLLYTLLVALVFLPIGLLSTAAIVYAYRVKGLVWAAPLAAVCLLGILIVTAIWLGISSFIHRKKGR